MKHGIAAWINEKSAYSFDQDLIEYGLACLVRYAAFGVITILVAVFLKLVPQTVLFLGLYSIQRNMTGGFHFKGAVICCITSVLFVLAGAAILALIPVGPVFCFIVTGVIGLIYSRYAPVIDQGKIAFSSEEVVHIRIKIMRIYLILAFSCLVFYGFGLTVFVRGIIVSMLANGLTLLMGKISNAS